MKFFRTKTGDARIPLQKWLWRSYFRSALVPLLCIELGFLAVYWASGRLTYERNIATIESVSQDYLVDVVAREAATIGQTLKGIEQLTALFNSQTARAFVTPYDPPASEKARYRFSDTGAFHTFRDNGTTATFYSGVKPIGPKEIEKVWRLAQLDPVMKSIKDSSPLISQLYVNTNDSYNRIYPYFDVISQYPVKMDIPSYNFYYEADAKHNPSRGVVWTDAYIDPAGSGWMVSAIAPTYVNGTLEAVPGIDITIDSIVKRVLDMDLPWNGYAVLVGRDGTIIALPKAGERDFGLRELKDHDYATAIGGDTFKPENFNIHKRADTKALAAELFRRKQGVTHADLNKDMTAAFAEIPGPGWRLVLLAPTSTIYASATSLREQLIFIGFVMVGILLVFYLGFFGYLFVRARAMSREVAQPLEGLSAMMDRMGAGAFEQTPPETNVDELENVGTHLTAMGRKLAAAELKSREQENKVREALVLEREASEGQRRFVRVMSHEIRTPLAIIDSSAQIMERRAGQFTPADITDRANKIRKATVRMTNVMTRSVRLLELDAGQEQPTLLPLDLREMIDGSAGDFQKLVSPRALRIETDTHLPVLGDTEMIRMALTALVDNADKYSPAGEPITILAERDGNDAIIAVRDCGTGIPPADRPHIFERFYRGSNSTKTAGGGIGLHVAHRFMTLHGGTIEVVDVPDGGCVALRLPLTTPAASAAAHGGA